MKSASALSPCPRCGKLIKASAKGAASHVAKNGCRTKRELVTVVRRLARSLKRTPKQKDLHKEGIYYLDPHFSSMEQMCEELGFRSNRISVSSWVKTAEDLAKQNGGRLPSVSKLNKKGLNGLVHCLTRNKKAFSHIKREFDRISDVRSFVAMAEKLSRRNGGKIPSGTWLTSNGHIRLYSAISRHPELFDHLEMETRDVKSPEEWVVIARELASKSPTGKLPSHSALKEMGYYGLTVAKYKFPDLFKEFTMERIKKRPEEWVAIAEQVARDNGGVLPRNGLLDTSLYAIKRTYPKLFAHIPQEEPAFLDTQQQVKNAKELERKYGGVPHYVWLTKNGFGGIYQAKRKHPEAFAGIVFTQNKLITEDKIAARVIEAERLANEHEGVLPSNNWLSTHGHGIIADTKRKFPEKFAHIKQVETSDLRTLEEWVRVAERLVEQHGMLPRGKWLNDNGYSGLNRQISLNPNKFSHISRIKRVKHTGDKIRRIIAKNNLKTVTSYINYREQNPELMLPSASVVQRKVRVSDGWKWTTTFVPVDRFVTTK